RAARARQGAGQMGQPSGDCGREADRQTSDPRGPASRYLHEAGRWIADEAPMRTTKRPTSSANREGASVIAEAKAHDDNDRARGGLDNRSDELAMETRAIWAKRQWLDKRQPRRH